MKNNLKILLYADSFNNKVGQTIPYMEFVSQFGEVILIHPQNDLDFWLKHGDVLFVPGGADVSSRNYKQAPSFYNGRANAHYEYLDEYLLKPWLETGKPTIGVCRGAQVINTVLGGDLFQHVYGHVQTKDRDVTTEAMYSDIEGFKVNEINSIHHQSIRNIAPDLEVIGWSHFYRNCPSLRLNKLFKHKWEVKNGKWAKDTNYHMVIEAYKSREESTMNIVAFQYHPEEFNCPFAIEQISKLLSKISHPKTVLSCP